MAAMSDLLSVITAPLRTGRWISVRLGFRAIRRAAALAAIQRSKVSTVGIILKIITRLRDDKFSSSMLPFVDINFLSTSMSPIRHCPRD